MKAVLAALCAAGVCAVGAPTIAHHSFPDTYIENETVTIAGELVQVLFRNPHSFMHVMVKEKDGSVVKYSVEWVGATELFGQGVSATTFKHGDYVVISGSPGRDPENRRVRMVSLRRPKDGFGWRLPPGRTMN